MKANSAYLIAGTAAFLCWGAVGAALAGEPPLEIGTRKTAAR